MFKKRVELESQGKHIFIYIYQKPRYENKNYYT